VKVRYANYQSAAAIDRAQPPVTDMWRGTAGVAPRTGNWKSCAFGLVIKKGNRQVGAFATKRFGTAIGNAVLIGDPKNQAAPSVECHVLFLGPRF